MKAICLKILVNLEGDNMLKLDKHTKLVILDAVESCSEANPEVIEKDTGHKVEQFEKFD